MREIIGEGVSPGRPSMRQWIQIVESVIAYHGSQSANPTFVMGHTGENSHTFSPSYQTQRWGIFFSDNPKFAALYGEPKAYRLNLSDTLNLDKDRGDTITAFVETLDPHDPVERPIWMDARNVQQGTWRMWQIFEGELGQRFVAFLRAEGYDSVTFYEANDDDAGDEHESQTIVVLDPHLIAR
jgi:hypothetical protein